MRSMNDSTLQVPEDISYEILGYFSYDDDSESLLKWALVSSSWARICRSRWTLELSSKNFQGLRELLESPLTSFSWVKNLVVLTFQSFSVEADWFRETVPYLAALKRVSSLSLIYPPRFSNFDELMDLLCVFPSLRSVMFSGVHISDQTWSPSGPCGCPSLTSITLEARNVGIFHWLQSQKATHAVHSFQAVVMNSKELELTDSFLQPSAGILQHLHITMRFPFLKFASPATFSLMNYKNLRSLKLENVRNFEFVPRVLKQITSTELRHLTLDWDSIRNEFPCGWSEIGDILSGDQFFNLSMLEIQLYVDNIYNKRFIAEAKAELQRRLSMHKRDGQRSYDLKLNPRQIYSFEDTGCPSCDGLHPDEWY